MKDASPKRICLLLNGPIKYDGRVIRVVRALTEFSDVDLLYINGQPDDQLLFPTRARLFSFPRPCSLWNKFVRHSLFHLEYQFLAREALRLDVRYDVVYVNDLPTLAPGVHLKNALGARLVYDAHEIYVETLKQLLPDAEPRHRRLALRLILRIMASIGSAAERRLVKAVDEFITVNHSLAEYFMAQYSVPSVRVVMNTPPFCEEPPPRRVDFRERYGWSPSDSIFVYQGSFTPGRALKPLLRALTLVHSRVKLVFIGDGGLQSELMREVARLGVTARVHFFGRVPPSDLPGLTRGADFGVNLVESNLSKRLAAANKFFEYLHAGLPVLCSDVIEHRRVFERYRVGVLVDNRPESIARGMMELLESTELEEFRAQCRAAAREYCWQNQLPVLKLAVRAP